MWRIQLGIALAFSAALSTPASAQSQEGAPTEVRAPSCTDSVQPGIDYGRCALWIEGRSLRRGRSGELVDRTGLFRSLRLESHVLGDSALAHAQTYSRLTRRGTVLSVIGAAFFVGAIVVNQSYECRREPTLGICTTNDDTHNLVAGGLLLGSLGFTVAGAVVTVRANRHAANAVLWHNERFAR